MERLNGSLQKFSSNISEKSKSLSIYSGQQLTKETILKQISKLQKAFPKLSPGFYDVLSERIKENNFSNQRLVDAIDNLIDNHTYQQLTIADIVSFDRRVELLTYRDLVEKVNQGFSFGDYRRLPSGKYISREDILTYNLGYLFEEN